MKNEIAEATNSIRKMLETSELPADERRRIAQESDWLKLVYGRFRSDSQSNNDRIYASSRLYMPLSLAPLAALVASVDDPDLWHVFFLGVVSVGLMLINIATADRERAARQQYVAWMVAIQNEIGLDTDAMSRRGDGLTLAKISRLALWLLLAAWAALAIAVGLGWIGET